MQFPIQINSLAPVPKGQPRISALFSFRYDAHLVPDLIGNLSAFVHDCIMWDDRGDHGLHTNEPLRRNALLQAARENGTDWVLAVDPDERFENRLAQEMPRLTSPNAGNVVWSFNVREMFAVDAWRCDGVWGGKVQIRLFPMRVAQTPLTLPLHGRWMDLPPHYKVRPTGLNLYHFHHLTAERDESRRKTYAAADPERYYNSIGYDYLADRRGMRLQPIPSARGYQPLWTLVEATGPVRPDVAVSPDPLETSLRFMKASLGRKGHAAAALRAGDLAKANAKDSDLSAMADILNNGIAGDSPAELWRRWTTGPATLTEGPRNGQGPLAVIVLCYQAAPETRETLAALLAQSDETEVVVVNSGGGDIQTLLHDMLPRVRLIDVKQPLFVGAARNIGIDASVGPWVSFLASDCPPCHGWVAGRLARHGAGAVAVATAVSPDRPGSWIAALTWAWRFHSRDPMVDPEKASLFGRSYCRSIFRHVGYFAPALRQAEDNEFNQRTDVLWPVEWAPEIQVLHKDPAGLRALLRDAETRGQRSFPPAGINWIQFEKRIRHRVKNSISMDVPEHLQPKGLARRFLQWGHRLYAKAFWKGFSESLARHREAEQAFARAQALLASGDPGALSCAEKAVLREPYAVDRWVLLGECHARLTQDKEKAKAAFERALQLSPTYVPALKSALAHLTNPAEALDFAEKAVTLAPAVPGLRMLAAGAAENAGNSALALRHLRHALAYDPTSVAVHQALSELHRRMGEAALAACRDETVRRLGKPVATHH